MKAFRRKNMRHTTPRRRFLACSMGAFGSALSMPVFIKGSALGLNGQTPPSNRILMGSIGVGSMGRFDVTNLMKVQDTRIACVCDVVKSRRERAKSLVDKHYGNKDCTVYRDFRELIKHTDLQAVSITTQDHWHAVIASECARAGLDMYCQKPLGMTVEECRAMIKTVRNRKSIFQTGTQQRSDRNFRFACELARNGYLGKVHTVKTATPGPRYKRTYKKPPVEEQVPEGFDFDMFVGPAQMRPYNGGLWAWPDWYLIRDYCVGFILNWGVHHLDIACWGLPELAASPCTVNFTGHYRSDGLTDNINDWKGAFEYANGVKLLFSDTGHPHRQGCEFIGDKGRVHVNRKGISATPESLLEVKIKPGEVHLLRGRAESHYENFIQSVRTRKDPIAPVEAGSRASIMGMIAEIAIKLREKLTWDPASHRFTDNDRANKLLSHPMRKPWHL